MRSRKPVRRLASVLIASLFVAAPLVQAEVPGPTPAAPQAPPPSPLSARIFEIRELARYVPEKAERQLLPLAAEAKAAGTRQYADFLFVKALVRQYLGHPLEAVAIADDVIKMGREQGDTIALIKGQLAKSYALYDLNQLKPSHDLVWDAEKLVAGTGDLKLRVTVLTNSGQAYSEDGNFPAALGKMQEALVLARQTGDPITRVMVLRALAVLYDQTKEYQKGFEALDEAVALAAPTGSPGRMATLRTTEYGLAIDSNQPRRALKALLEGLAFERRIGADAMIAETLVNLSDLYLKEHDYPKVLDYAQQAIDLARQHNDPATEATGRINIGQALLATGHVAEGKRSFEAGLKAYEQNGDKPELQSVLMEYGSALEQAGDYLGAVKAYHRERKLSNELFEKRRQKALVDMQVKYEAVAKQKQIELLKRENDVKSAELDNRRLQQRVWWLLAVVFALAAVIVGLLYRKVRHANAQLEVKNQELKQQSSRDPLTALYNRRHFQDFMRSHVPSEKRGAGTTCEEMVGALFLLDVDHFKHVNDTYGHAAGDAVLRMIAENLREILRETDMIVRWGGEEFLAFLPAIPRSGLEEVARRILAGISSHTVEYQDTRLSVNVSIGFAPFPLVPGAQSIPWERAVNLVDMALYLAKAHGRNRAYGVRGFPKYGPDALAAVEQDLEKAWRNGYVDLSIVLGGWPDKASLSAATTQAA